MRGKTKAGKSLDERLRAVRESAESHHRAAVAPEAVTPVSDPAPILDLAPVPASFDAAVDSPPEPAVDVPVDAAADTPSEAAVEAPLDPPADTPFVPLVETPLDPPADTPPEAAVETPLDPPADAPNVVSVETPLDAPADTPPEPVVETPLDAPADAPNVASVEALLYAPVEAAVVPSVEAPSAPVESFAAELAPSPREETPTATHESDLAEVAHLLWAASEGDTLLASGADASVSPRRLEQGAGRFQLAGVGPDTRQREQEARPPRRGLRFAPASHEGDRSAGAEPEPPAVVAGPAADDAQTPILAELIDDQLESLATVATAADVATQIAPAADAAVESEAPAAPAPEIDEIPLARRLFGFGGRRRVGERPAPAASEPEPLWPEPVATEPVATEPVATEPVATELVAPEPVLADEPEADPEPALAFEPTPTGTEPETEPVWAYEPTPIATDPEADPEPALAFEATPTPTEPEADPEPALVFEVTPTRTEPEPEPELLDPAAPAVTEPEPVLLDAPAPAWTAPEPEPMPIVPAPTTPEPATVDEGPWSHPDRAGRFGRIGTTMIDRGLITNEQLDAALEVQRTTGRRVGEILVGMGALSRFELARVLADHMGVPFVDLRAKPPDAILGALLPEEVARRYRALVIDRWNNQLVIAMANPSDLFALDDLQMVMRQPIITAMAVEEDLLAAIDSVYRVSDVETTLDAATSDYVSKTDEAAMGAVEVDEGPVVRLVNALLDQAIRDHASDLHIEPSSSRIAIRYRVDGVLHDSSDVPLALLRPLVSRVKILSNLDIAQNRIAQDGRFSVVVQGRPVDIRVVTVPTAAGEAVILRLLDPTRDTLDISSLGLNAAEEARFVPPFFASQGAAFIVGPTGSGKTSTVYTLLSEINTRSKSIISVEDPVEYRLDGIKQIQANPRVGLTFATTLPSILRSDPDIVFIGEVRDAETARIAADASITGHLVLSTLHATRSAAAPMRLIEMGVEPYLVASALTLVAAQRLARKLCDRCAQAVDAAQIDRLRDLGATDEILEGATIRHAVGCPACRNTGYAGRLPILEIMPVSEQISRLILDRAPRAQIERLAVEEGMETMTTAAMRRVASGVLSIEEMMRIVS